MNGKRTVKAVMHGTAWWVLDARFRGMSTEQIRSLKMKVRIFHLTPWGEVEDGEGDPVQEERGEVMVEQARNLAKSRGKHSVQQKA